MEQERIWDELYGARLTWKRESITLPKVLKNKKILELGVGTGKTLVSILGQKPKKVYAVDFSSKAIERSRERFEGKVTLVQANVNDLPFEDESFDVVVCYYVLNNSLKKDRTGIVKEIRRVLKKGGACLFEDFSVNDLRNEGKKHRSDKNTIVKKNGLMCHFFDEKELRILFGDFKIKIEKKSFYPIKNVKAMREIITVVGKK
jgi:ubiquinone/menaquinone biosynthesis C-methylase UbiE